MTSRKVEQVQRLGEQPRSKQCGRLYARFMELRGRRVVEAAGSLWHSVEAGFYSSVRYQDLLRPEPAELDSMLRKERALGVRFLSADDVGLPSGVYVCRDKAYGFHCVKGTIRHKTRRGLQNCEIREVTTEELLSQGLTINRETLSRQGRRDPEFGQRKQWQRLARAIGQAQGVGALGAFVGGALAAYVIYCREDGWFHIMHQMSRSSMLKLYPNDALVYQATKVALEDPEIETACFGSVGLVSGDGLHRFKEHYGYAVEPARWAVRLHPALAPAVSSRFAENTIGLLRRFWPNDQRLERTESIVLGAHLSYRPPAASLVRASPKDKEALTM